jgi:hypothetical protein
MADFPPVQATVLTETIPAYVYVQFNDDDNVQAFFSSYNDATQYYLDWFSGINLPIYTGLSGSLLDWVATGLYGFMRPTLESVGSMALGPLNSTPLNTIVLNGFVPAVASTFTIASDDIFKRIMTWQLYKGDGKVCTLKWLKRRVLRFLKGANGTDVNVADTSEVSITISGDIVTIDVSAVTGVSNSILNAFLYIIEGGIVELPPQFAYQVIT